MNFKFLTYWQKKKLLIILLPVNLSSQYVSTTPIVVGVDFATNSQQSWNKKQRYLPVDVDDVLFLGELQRQVFGLLHVITLHYDGGPEVPAGLYFYDRRHRGHDHGHWYVEPLTVVAQRLRVITQRRRDHAVPFVVVGQHRQCVARAAFLEASHVRKRKKKRSDYNVGRNVAWHESRHVSVRLSGHLWLICQSTNNKCKKCVMSVLDRKWSNHIGDKTYGIQWIFIDVIYSGKMSRKNMIKISIKNRRRNQWRSLK